MVSVPQARQQTVTAPLARQSLVMPDGSREEKELAQAVGREALSWQDTLDEGMALDADQRFAESINGILRGEGGFLHARGQSAAEGLDATSDRLKAAYDDAFGDISETARQRVRGAMARRLQAALAQSSEHAVGQRDEWIATSSGARAAMAMDHALRAAGNEEETREQLALGMAEIQRQGEVLGWSPDVVTFKTREFRSATRLGIARQIGTADAQAGLAYLDKHASDIMGGAALKLREELKGEAAFQRGRAYADSMFFGGAGAKVAPKFFSLLHKRESGGSYDTLFGHSQRAGGKFAGVKVSTMTLGELYEFTDPTGEYGQWVKAELARKGHQSRVATPMGAGQIVGKTLKATAREMGLPPTTVFSPAVQDAMIMHLARKAIIGKGTAEAKRAALRGVWEGFKSTAPEALDQVIAEIENAPERLPQPSATERQAQYAQIVSMTDPDARRAAMQQWEMLSSVEAGQRKIQRAELEQAVFEHIEAGKPVDDLPLEIRQSLGVSEMSSLRAYAKTLASGQGVKTDWSADYQLREMAQKDPRKFLETNLMEYRDKFSDQDWRSIRDLRASVEKGLGGAAVSYDRIRTTLNVLTNSALDWDASPNTPDGARAMKAWGLLRGSIDRWTQENPDEKLTDQTLFAMAGEVIASMGGPEDIAAPIDDRIAGAEGAFYNLSQLAAEDPERFAGMNLPDMWQDMSPAQRSALTTLQREAKDRLRRDGMTAAQEGVEAAFVEEQDRVFQTLMDLAGTDPDAFMATDLQQLYRDLGPERFRELSRLRLSIARGERSGSGSSVTGVTIASIGSNTRTLMQEAGIDDKPEERAAFERAMLGVAQSYLDSRGRDMEPAEMNTLGRALLQEITIDGGSVWSSEPRMFELSGEQVQKIMGGAFDELEVGDRAVTKAELDEVARALISRNGVAPTLPEIFVELLR